MQLNLKFPQWVNPATNVWEQLDPDARRAFVEALARAIVKAADHREPDTRKMIHEKNNER